MMLTSRAGLLGGVVTLIVSCVGTRAEVAPAALDGRVSIEVMPARRGAVREVGSFFGAVEPRRSIRVSAEVGGLAESVLVEEGDLVRGGELLVQVDEEPYRLAEDQAVQALAAAQVRVDQVERTLAMEEAQLEAGLKQARASVDMAEAQLARVEAGARSEEKGQLKAVLEGARAGMENAELQLGRVKALVAAGASTQQQLELAQAAFRTSVAGYDQALQGYRLVVRGARTEDRDAARAALRQAEAGFEAAMAALEALAIRDKELDAAIIQVAQAELGLENARLQRRRTRILAPLGNGEEAWVQARLVNGGELVAPGVPLAELLVLDRPRLVFQVAGGDVVHLEAGRPLDAFCHGDPRPQRTGTVVLVGRQAHPQNATFPVEVELDNADRGLRAGMICEVRPELTVREGLLVPRDAIMDTQGGMTLLVEQDGVLRQRNVEILGVQAGIAAVGSGLEEGERVVVVGTRLANDGDEVVVRAERPPVLRPGVPAGAAD